MLTWLRTSSGPKILTELVSQNTEISHASLDALSQDYNTTHHFRKLLVATGVLPERNENLARLELWSADVLAHLPQHQMKIIRPFTEWHHPRRTTPVIPRPIHPRRRHQRSQGHPCRDRLPEPAR